MLSDLSHGHGAAWPPVLPRGGAAVRAAARSSAFLPEGGPREADG